MTHMTDLRCAAELVTRARGFLAFFGLRARDTGDMRRAKRQPDPGLSQHGHRDEAVNDGYNQCRRL